MRSPNGYALGACLFFLANLMDAFTLKSYGVTFFISGVFLTVIWLMGEVRRDALVRRDG